MPTLKEEELLFFIIGKRIRDLRVKKGYSNQEAFAYVSDIPRAQYGRYEKGTNMTIVSLFKILKEHKITFEEFFKEGFEDVNKTLKGKK